MCKVIAQFGTARSISFLMARAVFLLILSEGGRRDLQSTNQHRPAAMSEEQRKQLFEKWGEDYSDKELWELERTYKSLADDYKGGLSSRQRMNLIDLSRWRLERQKQIDAGDINAAKKISDMIKATMDSEAMKATDIKPTSVTLVYCPSVSFLLAITAQIFFQKELLPF